MDFIESNKLQRQRKELRKRFQNIDKDIDNLKEEALPKVAFKRVSNWNKSIRPKINLSEEISILTWRIAHANSDTDEGKSGGYRVFYCKLGSNRLLLLGIYYKADIENDAYSEIVRSLVESAKEVILENKS